MNPWLLVLALLLGVVAPCAVVAALAWLALRVRAHRAAPTYTPARLADLVGRPLDPKDPTP